MKKHLTHPTRIKNTHNIHMTVHRKNNTMYDNKVIKMLLYMLCSFFVVSEEWRAQGASNTNRKEQQKIKITWNT